MTTLQSAPTDQLSALRRSEPAVYAELYDQHGAAMFRVALGLIGDRAEAEDAVQDAFLGLVGLANQSAARLAAIESVAAYLFGALRHAALRRRAVRARQPEPRAQMPAALAPAPAPGEDPELERALAGLPPEQRDVIALKIDGGLTFAEIAAILGIPLNTAASRYRYGLAKLREALGGSSDE